MSAIKEEGMAVTHIEVEGVNSYRRDDTFGPVAQWIDQYIPDVQVVGSTLIRSFYLFSRLNISIFHVEVLENLEISLSRYVGNAIWLYSCKFLLKP